MRYDRLVVALAAVLLMLRSVPMHAQAGAATDVIVGRVADSSTRAPIAQATVSATSSANGITRTATTSNDGRYQLVFADGGGRYVLRVRRLGYRERTLTVVRGAESDRISADVALTLGPLLLDSVEGEGPDDNTFGNPNVPVWGRADEERRHQFESSVTMPVHKGVELAFVGRLVSGIPFSARLATDINGDGQRNDRSFVFDPNSPTTDPSVAAGMRQLLATGTSTARQCLPSQFGQPAERNWCVGPWVPGFDLKLTTTPRVSFAQKLTFSLTALNTLVGIDELLHGRDNIRGWGQDASVDQPLLFVTGFDPVSQTFKYRVNQHFGAASGALNPFRIPFVLSLQGRMSLGGK
jgi:hypothetical protein